MLSWNDATARMISRRESLPLRSVSIALNASRIEPYFSLMAPRMLCVILLSWVSVTVRFAIAVGLLRVGEPSVLKIS